MRTQLLELLLSSRVGLLSFLFFFGRFKGTKFTSWSHKFSMSCAHVNVVHLTSRAAFAAVRTETVNSSF